MIKSAPLLQNLHTHSIYCDGKDTLEEMVEAAIALGFETIGFSSHSFTPFDESYCMKDEQGYRAECEELKLRYKGRISIVCGIEQDYFSPLPAEPYDYIIGSVHYIKKSGEYIPVDESAEILLKAAERHYNGNMVKLCRDYYRQVADVAEKTGCDIIGHFDLITKFSDRLPGLVDEADPCYTSAQDEAIERLVSLGKIFEVNTGAMARGYRTTPYPSKRVLEKIHSLGGRLILSSDCHNSSQLDFGYEAALELIKSCGFKEIYCYKNGGFRPFPL